MSLTLTTTLTLSSQSVANNTSTVAWKVKYSKSSTTYNNNGVDYYVNVDGTRVKTGTWTPKQGTTSGTIASGTTTIKHNADGTHAQVRAYAKVYNTGFSPSSADDYSAYLTLPKIVRTFTVSYNANGGTGVPASQTKTYGTNLTLSSTKPTRDKYDFKGWATSSTGTVAYQAGGTYTANAAVTLYAVWELKTYKISYDANGGADAPESQSKIHDTNITLSSTQPTRDGYNFKGWATSSSGTVVYQSGETYSENAALALYAVWELKTYTISYDANGGTGAPASQTKTYGVNLTLSSTQPTRSTVESDGSVTEYIFKGWSISSTLKHADYVSGDTFTTNADTTLYAVWSTMADELAKVIQLKDINGNNIYPVVRSGINDIAEASSQPLGISCGGTGATTPRQMIDNLKLLDYVYPIGVIYMSVSSTNPSILFGGTWERIGVGRTLVSAGGDENAVVDVNTYTDRGANDAQVTWFPVGETGGELSHTLTAAQMPAHTHGPGTLKGYYRTRGSDNDTSTVRGSVDYVYSAYDHNTSAGSVVINSGATGSTGSGSAHNIMSTYFAVYMWKRVA